MCVRGKVTTAYLNQLDVDLDECSLQSSLQRVDRLLIASDVFLDLSGLGLLLLQTPLQSQHFLGVEGLAIIQRTNHE